MYGGSVDLLVFAGPSGLCWYCKLCKMWHCRSHVASCAFRGRHKRAPGPFLTQNAVIRASSWQLRVEILYTPSP
jgi:hypothetical protein